MQSDTIRSESPQSAGVLAALERIEARLSALEERLAPLETLTRQAPGAAAALGDTLDDWADRAAARGIDLEQRLTSVTRLLERLSDPATVSLLERGLSLAEQAPNVIAALADTFDQHADALAERGVDLEQRRAQVLGTLERLTSPEVLGGLQALLKHTEALAVLLDSGMLAEGALRVTAQAGHALAAAAETDGLERVGAFGLLRAMGEPDVQRATALAVRFARALGRDIERGATPEQLAAEERPAALPERATDSDRSSEHG